MGSGGFLLGDGNDACLHGNTVKFVGSSNLEKNDTANHGEHICNGFHLGSELRVWSGWIF
jgi:hypothetical protein